METDSLVNVEPIKQEIEDDRLDDDNEAENMYQNRNIHYLNTINVNVST